MPFTLSHPAAILPLHKWIRARLPLTALVIGSMSPDFAYFVPLGLGYLSHTILGILYFCLPAGLLAWLVFEYLLKTPTLMLMPDAVRTRFSLQRNRLSLTGIVSASAALMLGALTHVIWDAFTHLRPPFVTSYQVFRTVVFDLEGGPIRFYKVLQHGSTLLGLIVLALAIRSWWRTNAPRSPDPHMIVPVFWRTGALSVVVFSSLIGAAVYYLLHPDRSIERKLYQLCIGGMSGFVVAWILLAVIITIRRPNLQT